MTNEDLFRLMRDYHIAKVSFWQDGRIRTAIALPPEQEIVREDLDPQKDRERIEKLMFAHVEG